MKYQICFICLCFLIFAARTDFIIFTSEKQSALYAGQISLDTPLSIVNIELIDDKLNYPRNIAVNYKKKKFYICDTVYSDIPEAYIYEYTYFIGIFYIFSIILLKMNLGN